HPATCNRSGCHLRPSWPVCSQRSICDSRTPTTPFGRRRRRATRQPSGARFPDSASCDLHDLDAVLGLQVQPLPLEDRRTRRAVLLRILHVLVDLLAARAIEVLEVKLNEAELFVADVQVVARMYAQVRDRATGFQQLQVLI